MFITNNDNNNNNNSISALEIRALPTIAVCSNNLQLVHKSII